MSRAVPRRMLPVFVLAALCALPAGADSLWGRFVEASDSSQDPAIIEAVAAGDFDTRVEICAAMGRRADPAAGSLLAWLLATTERGNAAQAEHLLRVLLESVFAPERAPEALQQRYEANREALADAQARWSTFSDPQLRAALLRILSLVERDRALPALAAAGADIVKRARDLRGILPPGETGLALDFLSTVEAIGTRDFLDQCLSLAALSREKPVVDRARQAAMAVRGRAWTPSPQPW